MEPAGKILEFKIRKQIYQKILENPGLHLRELDRLTDVSFGCLRYHLKYLEKTELIKTCNDGGFTRFYVTNNVGKLDKILLNILRQKTLRNIIIIMLLREQNGPLYKEDLKNIEKFEKWYYPERFLIKKHRTTIEFHLEKLIQAGIMKKIKINRRTGYELIDCMNIWDFLVRYNHSLDYKELRNTVKWCSENIIPKKLDGFLSEVFEVFPHPYYI